MRKEHLGRLNIVNKSDGLCAGVCGSLAVSIDQTSVYIRLSGVQIIVLSPRLEITPAFYLMVPGSSCTVTRCKYPDVMNPETVG